MPRLFRTLQFRLAAAFVLWTAMFHLALLLGIPLIREPYVLERMDRDLARAVESVPDRLAALGGPPAEFAGLGLEGDFVAQLHDSSGQVLLASDNLGDRVLPFRPPRVPLNEVGGNQPRITASAFASGSIPRRDAEARSRGEMRRLRVGAFRIVVPGQDPVYLVVGSSTDLAEQMSAFLQWTLAAALMAGTVGAGIAGWIVAGAFAGRIKKITGAVSQVSPDKLGNRIQLPESDDEVGGMAAEVNAMLHRLSVAVQSHERFIAHVSHELKTPVSALLTESQVLRYTRPDIKAYEAFVSNVEDEMRRLGRMVESFLMLARFGHGRRFLAETLVSINDIALESVEHSALLAHHHGVKLGVSLHDPGNNGPEAVVRGDAELLRVVVDNLIRNAVQFSKAKQRVEVAVDCTDSAVVLSVLDEGPGIPEEYLGRIFDRFAQAPTVPEAGRRGTGLGLTITKGVVDLHNGVISVQNRAGGGCVFSVRLPLAEEPRQGNGRVTPVTVRSQAEPSPL